MRPYTTARDERLRERIRRWADEHVRQLDDDEASDEEAVELVRRMGRDGLLKNVVARADGGADTEVRSLALVIAREELACASALADTMFAMQGLGSYPITLAGSTTLRRRLLPEVARGRLVCGFAITEEEAGSDVSAMRTSAVRDGSGWILEGEKKFISNAGVADLYSVFARAADGAVTAFAVEADNPGLVVSERMTLNARHPIGRIRFDACRVPGGARLGRPGKGLEVAFQTLDTFRPTVGAAACGMARRALEESLDRVRRRSQFGRPLARFQATQLRLADMKTRLEAARGLVYRAAWTRDRGEPPTLTAAMAKLAATDWAHRIVDDAVQLHGGEGVVRGNIVERLYREVRALRIYEGTSEIQRLVIARQLLD